MNINLTWAGKTSIVRFNETKDDGLIRRDICGLNILAANNVKASIQNDPYIIFLRALSEQYACASCVGYLSLKDIINDPSEIFSDFNATPYSRVPIGLYGGTFYDLTQFPTEDACFFPSVNDAFWKSQTNHTAPDDIGNIIGDDALALFVGVKDAQRLEKILTVFTDESTLRQELAAQCSLIVTTGGDASHFEVHASSFSELAAIDEPISVALEAVKTSSWYRHNKNDLKWDSDGNECLILNSR